MQNKREQIRKAAATVIAREGFHGATTDMIAREAGVAVGTIYNYFTSKEEILSYIFEVEYQKREKLFQVIDQQPVLVLEKIHRLLEGHFKEVIDDPAVATIVVNERNFPRKCRINGIIMFEGFPGFIRQLFQQGIDGGEFRQVNPQLLAFIVFGAVEALMERYITELERGEKTETTIESGIREVMGLLSHGLSRGN